MLAGTTGRGGKSLAAERSALDFAELFATDHLAIDDAVYDELRQHFSEDDWWSSG